jgi:hypothetical protein
MDIAPAFGALAGLTGIANTVPYVRDTVRRSTRPHRGTWLIWTLLAVVACLSQRAGGASWSLIMCATQVVMDGLVLVLAVRFGTGALSGPEAGLLVLAGAGVGGWLLADDPMVATACVVAADLTAFALMLPKSWSDPGSETLSTFGIASLGGALATLATEPAPPLLLYPVYFCLANGAMALMLWWRRAGRDSGRPRPGRRRSPCRGAPARGRRAPAP